MAMNDDIGSNMEKLLASRDCLRDGLEKSKCLASQIDETRSSLQKKTEKLPLLKNELCSTFTRKSTLSAVGECADRAFGPVAAVLKIYDSVCGLEKSLQAGPTYGNITQYLSLMKQLEEGLTFMSNNCGLAVQWMEEIGKFLDENERNDDMYVLKVKKSLRVLSELKAMEARARLNGGLLSDSYNMLEVLFRQLVKENPNNSELQPIIERLKSKDRLENCKTIFVDVRSANARTALQALDLNYLDFEISDSDSIQKFEEQIVQWGKHIEFAVKQVLIAEYETSKSVFEIFGRETSLECFANITSQSGFLALLEFGIKITEAKKDAVKLLKLLEIFTILDKLRVDFNMLFGSKPCLEIQNLTRELIKRVVDGACEIFQELSVQVKAQRYNIMPPSDGSVPRLVTFVMNYCVMLLEDSYKPILLQVLSIHQIWNKKKSHNGILREEFQSILNSLEINLETWSKTFEDTSLCYFFLMNNHIYLYEFLQGTSFGDLMGENMLHGYKEKMKNYAHAYLKHSWGKLPPILSEDGLLLFSSGRASAQELAKKRFRDFNDTFEHLYKKQSRWVISDNSALREKATQLIIHTVVPTYRSFLHNYSYLVENGSSPSKYVKYSASNLEAMLSSLFLQANVNELGRSSSSKSNRFIQPNLSKLNRSSTLKSNHLIGKLRNAVANQFRVAPIST